MVGARLWWRPCGVAWDPEQMVEYIDPGFWDAEWKGFEDARDNRRGERMVGRR